MTDIIIVVLVIAVVASALLFIRREKKSGNRCIGCPHGKNCNGSCGTDKDK